MPPMATLTRVRLMPHTAISPKTRLTASTRGVIARIDSRTCLQTTKSTSQLAIRLRKNERTRSSRKYTVSSEYTISPAPMRISTPGMRSNSSSFSSLSIAR